MVLITYGRFRWLVEKAPGDKVTEREDGRAHEEERFERQPKPGVPNSNREKQSVQTVDDCVAQR